jgi:hypothetical protein
MAVQNLYCSPNILRVIKSRRMRWARNVTRMAEGRGLYRVLVAKPEGKRTLGRPRHRWEDNIKIYCKKVRCGCMDWIELAQDRERWRALLTAVMNIRVLQNAGNFLTSWKPGSVSRTLIHEISNKVMVIQMLSEYHTKHSYYIPGEKTQNF